MEPADREMTAADVLAFLDLVAAERVRIWVDGGWAVDACLGAQTRPHEDLDIVIEERDLSTAVAVLHGRGYRPVPRSDTRPWNFVLGDDGGREIDFHVIVLDPLGNGQYGPPENADSYPAEALVGTGRIDGRPVACTTPEWLVHSHTGYQVDETDWADMSALCARFGIPMPDDYRRFQ